VDLNINPLSIITHKLVSVTRVTVHVVVAIRGATVGEENQNLVNTFGVLGKIVLMKAR
jgi:hypothetical protein